MIIFIIIHPSEVHAILNGRGRSASDASDQHNKSRGNLSEIQPAWDLGVMETAS
jgi:hypothetical protein